MNCLTCYYAEPVYDKHGLMLGIECRTHNMRLIVWDEAKDRHCGQYAERDDGE